MNKKYIKYSFGILSSSLLVVSFQNCSSGFDVDPIQKMEVLTSSSVFASKTPFASQIDRKDSGEAGGVINVVSPGAINQEDTPTQKKVPPSTYPTKKETGIEVINTSQPVVTGLSEEESSPNNTYQIPVSYHCTTVDPSHQSRITNSEKVFLKVASCNIEIKDQILNTKKISINRECLSSLSSKEIQDFTQGKSIPNAIIIENEKGDNLVTQREKYYSSGVFKSVWGREGFLSLLYSTQETQHYGKCDSRVSPLIVALGENIKGIDLTAPLSGIQFDILGENSFPYIHAKKQISWFKSSRTNYYFIALPNNRGEVNGINELFGDNTRGPDGKFASDGYAALAKFDEDGDGYISSKDSIFKDLRLWQDHNLDGHGTKAELYTLEEKGIEVIDLNYDPSYIETDAYGNQTTMKSVVKTKDGKLHLLFDLWFRFLDITK